MRQMFTRKFERLAASYSDAVFCDILGDENNDTRVRCQASQHSLASLSCAARLHSAAVQPVCWRPDPAGCLQRLMMDMQIKVTPTFKLFRGRTEAGAPACVQSLTGINESNLRRAVLDHLRPGEAGAEPEDAAAGAEPVGTSAEG